MSNKTTLRIPKSLKAEVRDPHAAQDEFTENQIGLQRLGFRTWLVAVTSTYFLARIEPMLGFGMLKTIGIAVIVGAFLIFGGVAVAILYTRISHLGMSAFVYIGGTDNMFWSSQKRLILTVLSLVVLAELAILLIR